MLRQILLFILWMEDICVKFQHGYVRGVVEGFVDFVEQILKLQLPKLWFRASPKIHRAPGWRLGGILQFILTKKAYSLVIEPQLSDHQMEYAEMLADGRNRKARWIAFRCWVCVLWSAALLIPVSLSGLVVKLWNLSQK